MNVPNAARAATFGIVETLLADIDGELYGAIDAETGAVTFDGMPSGSTYYAIAEIAGCALVTGAQVLAVRVVDVPGGGSLAAVPRYPM